MEGDMIGNVIKRSERMIAIQFEKLFERFDYNVTLNQDGLTILTGPNGYGKSTILKSIEAIGNELAGVMFFFSIDFKKITVWFENDRKIVIEKRDGDLLINDILIEGKLFMNGIEGFMDRRPYMSRIDEDTWFDRRRGVTYTLNEYLMAMYAREQHNFVGVIDETNSLPTELFTLLKDMKKLVGEVYFIKEQRLIRENRNRRDEQEVINVGGKCSTELFFDFKQIR